MCKRLCISTDETADRILNAAFAEPETTLPAGPYLKVAREHLAGHLRSPESEAVAEVFIRVTLLFLLTPDSVVPLSSDEEARAFAARHLVPLLP